ncbi:NAD(P)-dependent oxidoreductase [Pseudonocardia nigra]|uniref:NAD(P)-dependent oxidoreductase n=1 Tax=Pseudonocardia nigra TaxID=1921578 RepID=UPI001C607C6F|nr:NAD(P)-dependent oxidoreductase [Pseudonocardia nigra]
MGPTIGVLHPGQMGAAIAAQAVLTGNRVLWLPAGRSPATHDRALEAGLVPVPTLAELLAESAVVLSLCPPAAADDVARQVAAVGFRGVFVEANAVNPARVTVLADELEARGTVVVDGSVIGPPPSASSGARLYLAGAPEPVGTVAALFAGTAVAATALDGDVGAASALKMAFASYQKATRTLAAVAHALAARHGVTGPLLAEARAMAGLPLAELDYLPSVAARAWRWGPELREVGDSLAAEGLPTELAIGTAEVLARWEGQRDRWDVSVADVLAELAAFTGAAS